MPNPLDQIVLDERPWGSFERFVLNQPVTVKTITVAPGGVLSLQRHEHRDELWSVLSGSLLVQIGDTETLAATGDRFYIPRGQLHRLSAPEGAGGQLLEIAFGVFDEDDIERLDDRYGRS